MNNLFKILLLTSLLLTSIATIAPGDVNADGEIVTETAEGNHLFTSKFEFDGIWSTAVALSPTTFLTAGHAVKYQTQDAELGYIYPAYSGILDPLSYMQITQSINYCNNVAPGGKDIAIIKGTEPSKSMTHYLADKAPKIKVVDDINELRGQEVYTIGYPKESSGNYQIKKEGTIVKKDGYAIDTDIAPTAGGGQSGSGLYLKETYELIGILSGVGGKSTYFAPITSDVYQWINDNK